METKGEKSYKQNYYLKLCRKMLNGKSFLVADFILTQSEQVGICSVAEITWKLQPAYQLCRQRSWTVVSLSQKEILLSCFYGTLVQGTGCQLVAFPFFFFLYFCTCFCAAGQASGDTGGEILHIVQHRQCLKRLREFKEKQKVIFSLVLNFRLHDMHV